MDFIKVIRNEELADLMLAHRGCQSGHRDESVGSRAQPVLSTGRGRAAADASLHMCEAASDRKSTRLNSSHT